jgi:hypothetical protein
VQILFGHVTLLLALSVSLVGQDDTKSEIYGGIQFAHYSSVAFLTAVFVWNFTSWKGSTIMRKLLLILSLFLIASLPVMAQNNPKLEVFGGYQYQSVGGNLGWQIGSPYSGWDTAVTFNFSKHLGATGDFSGNYHSGNFGGGPYYTHIYTYAGGPVYSFGSGGNFKPFVHVLFGGAHITTPIMYGASPVYASQSGFTAMFGGGVDYKVKKSIAIRLAQFDWIYYYNKDLGDFIGANSSRGDSPNFADNVRISTGVVFRF